MIVILAAAVVGVCIVFGLMLYAICSDMGTDFWWPDDDDESEDESGDEWSRDWRRQ